VVSPFEPEAEARRIAVGDICVRVGLDGPQFVFGSGRILIQTLMCRVGVEILEPGSFSNQQLYQKRLLPLTDV